MKTLLFINDGSPCALHAAKLALNIAQKANAGLILANLVAEKSPVRAVVAVPAGAPVDAAELLTRNDGLRSELMSLNKQQPGCASAEIFQLDARDLSINDLANFINKNDVWMIVKGAGGPQSPVSYLSDQMQRVLNRVTCPLLLVPEKCAIKDFERMVYMADLRYCQLPVVKYLAKLAGAYDAALQVAHVAAKGLPEMEENYSQHVFNDAVRNVVRYNKLFFNNIREADLKKVADVLINSMHCDLLVLVNRQFHFEEIMGCDITNTLPDYLQVPVLVFPY